MNDVPGMRFLSMSLMSLLAIMACMPAHADTVVTRATDLRADRYVDAATLQALAGGTHVELLKTEAGWVQIRVDGKTGWVRATSMQGDAAAVAPQARLETGRSVTGKIVVAAGIRGVPKASRHALIIGVDSISSPGALMRRWPGVDVDVDSARMIAQRLGIHDDNVDVISGVDATRAGIDSALERLAQRVQPGDQVLLYFSGPGVMAADGVSALCVAAWVTADGQTLPTQALVRQLQSVFANADKVLMVSDAAYARTPGTGATAPLKIASPPMAAATGACPASASAIPTEMRLVDAAIASGAPPMNVAHIQAAGAQQGIDHADAGSVFTQALVDCFLGDAANPNGFASISIDELGRCVNQKGHAGVGDGASAPSTMASVTGNGGYSPASGVATTATSISGAVAPGAGASGTVSTPPQAAIADVIAQSDGRVRVEVIATPSTLAIGRDYLNVQVTSGSAGFVYLILLGSDGKSFYLLFPNDLDRDNRIAAGETLQLPRPAWRVQSQGPAGRDVLLAVVAESERDLSAFAGQKAGPFSTVLTDAQGRAQLQWLLARSAQAETSGCVTGGRRRNLSVVKACSDAFGAARMELVER